MEQMNEYDNSWINNTLKDFQYNYGKIKHNLQTL